MLNIDEPIIEQSELQIDNHISVEQGCDAMVIEKVNTVEHDNKQIIKDANVIKIVTIKISVRDVEVERIEKMKQHDDIGKELEIVD